MELIFKLLSENPNMLVPIAKDYIEKYKPVVYGLLQEIEEIYKDYSNNTEHPATIAKVKKICMMHM